MYDVKFTTSNNVKINLNAQSASLGGIPIGFEKFTINKNIPAGWLPCLGGEYSRDMYIELFKWANTQPGLIIDETNWQTLATNQNGNVSHFSNGDGSTTFRVPALKCWITCADKIDQVGGFLAEHLPNVGGKTIQPLSDTPSQDQTENDYAGKSLAYYDNTTTNNVVPTSIVGLYLIKAFGEITPIDTATAQNLATGLENVQRRISTIEGDKSNATTIQELNNRLGKLENSGLTLQAIENRLTAFETNLSTNAGNIEKLNTRITTLENAKTIKTYESPPQAFTNESYVSIEHNLNLDPSTAIGEIIAVCKIANNGWTIGDKIAQIAIIDDDWMPVAAKPQISANQAYIMLSQFGILAMPKTGNKQMTLDPNKWDLIFKIIYKE